MKIGIITTHFSHNFGAVLQCISLEKYLELMGHEVVIINYCPRYLEQQDTVFPNVIEHARWAAKEYRDYNFVYRGYRIARRILRAIIKYCSFYTRKQRTDAFNSFMKENMNLTKKYRTIRELQDNAPKCDIYICGSDQIWNPYATCGLDLAYFLAFGDSCVKRVSYAVSACELNIKKHEKFLYRYLSDFDMISIRESELKLELSHLLNQRIEICIDPTLLMNSFFFSKLEKKPSFILPRYVLVYGFRDTSNKYLLGESALYVSKKLNIPIINISYHKIIFPEKVNNVLAASPEEFLYYIHNAEYVVTNSFHGTMFSLIYHKKFIICSDNSRTIRMKEITDRIAQSHRIVSTYDENILIKLLNTELDYNQVDISIQEFRQKSMDYLLKCCDFTNR